MRGVLIDLDGTMASHKAALPPKELTPEQAAYNKFAPYLMTSVDTDPVLCAAERRAIPEILGPGTWHIFGGHGPEKVLEVE